MTIYCLLFIAFCFLLLIIWLYLSRFIYGLFPDFIARKLSDDDIFEIRKSGLVHKTTQKGAEGIDKDRRVKGRWGIGSFSRQFRKSAFFFIRNCMPIESEQYNDSRKYTHIIEINNITDEQLEKMRIRKYDNALIVCGDFEILSVNSVIIKEIEESKIQRKSRLIQSAKSNLTGKSMCYSIVSLFLAALLICLIFLCVDLIN